MNGQTTNGSGPIDYRSLWYSNNGVITSKNASDVEISGGFKLTSGSPSLGKFLQSSDANGTASWASVPSYSLPMASSTNLGGVKVGSGLLIDNTGILSTNLSNGTEMLTENGNTGIVRSGRDNNFYGNIGNNATDLSVPLATSTILGATGGYSTAMGTATRASGIYSTAMGVLTDATGAYSTAFGSGTEASGVLSTAMGRNINAKSYGEIALGSFSTDYTPNSSTTWDPADRLFVVGNGYDDYSRSDALVILKNGKTGIGTSSPQHTLDVNGDARVGWRGYSTKMYVSPYEIHFTGSSDLNSGGSLELTSGADGWYSAFVPNGYKLTGCYFWFDNGPDNFIIKYGAYNSSGSTNVHTFSGHNSSGGISYTTTNFNGADVPSGKYVFIRIINDSGNKAEFTGGYFRMERE